MTLNNVQYGRASAARAIKYLSQRLKRLSSYCKFKRLGEEIIIYMHTS